MNIAANYKNKRDPNEITKTLTDVLSHYKGYILGMSELLGTETLLGLGGLEAFAIEGLLKENTKTADEIRVENVRRSIFASLLDTSIGAYYTKDIINGNAIFSGKTKDAVSNLEDYLMILCDAQDIAETTNIGSGLVFLKETDNKTPPSAGGASTLASMKSMICEYEPSSLAAKADSSGFGIGTAGKVIATEQSTKRIQTKEQPIANKDGTMRSPTMLNKKLSAFVIKDRSFCYGNKRLDHLSLFFNGISNIELSRCTPYIEIEVHNRNFEGKTKYYLNPAGYMKFNEGFGGDKSVMVPEAFANLTPVGGESDPNRYDVNFMDIFTSPQTAVNADINNSGGIKPSFDIFNSSKSNEQKVLEPFAPQATLKDLTLTTKSAGQGFVSKKAGSMSLTIHDRSRIKDFAPLISINQLAGARMKITFGWSHPDASVSSDNLIGRYLDSMKSSQFYLITASDIRFENNGADVTVQLISTSMQNFLDVPAAAGTLIPLRNVAPVIENAIEAIITEKENKKSGTFKEPKSVKLHPKLDLLINTVNSVYSVVSSTDYANLLDTISTGTNEEIIAAVEAVLKIKAGDSSNNDIITSLKVSLSKKLREKYETLFHVDEKGKLSQPDYFGERCLVNGAKPDARIHKRLYMTSDEDKSGLQYCSLGKIIANFVAAPMLSTGEYSEVQLYFYPLNNSCGAARIHTTASLPFLKTEIATLFESEESEDGDKEATTSGSLTTMTFFKKIASLTQTTDFSAYGLEEYSVNQTNKNVEKEFEKLKDVKIYGDFRNTSTSASDIPAEGILESFMVENNDVHVKKVLKEKYPNASDAFIDFQLLLLKKKKIKVIEAGRGNITKVENYLSNYKSKDSTVVNSYNQGDKEKQDAILKASIKISFKEDASKEKFERLKVIYNSDNMGPQDPNEFKLPDLDIIMETMAPIVAIEPDHALAEGFGGFLAGRPSKQSSGYYLNGSILKIHIVDKSTLGGEQPELASQILFNGKLDLAGDTNAMEALAGGINKLTNKQLKDFIKRHYATVVYGANSSTVKSINISSTTSDRISQAKFLTLRKQLREGTISKSDSTIAEEVRVVPASIDLQMFGCPFIDRGQIIFVDMGTDTDLDNTYVVNSVTHSIKQGDFTTSVGLKVGHQGTISNLKNGILAKYRKSKS